MNALERLRGGESVFGLLQTFADAGLSELAAWAGYDFVVLDAEHGMFDEVALLAALRTLSGTKAVSIVRVRGQNENAVARVLDLGAEGVIVPDVRTVEQAAKIAFAATRRWTSGLRGDRYGCALTAPGAAKVIPLVMVLIESPQGVSQVEAILDVEGIDGAIVGPGDLSTHLGVPGQFASAAFVSAVDRVEQATRAHRKILGGKAYPGVSIPTLLARGHRLIIVERDLPLIRHAFVAALEAAKLG